MKPISIISNPRITFQPLAKKRKTVSSEPSVLDTVAFGPIAGPAKPEHSLSDPGDVRSEKQPAIQARTGSPATTVSAAPVVLTDLGDDVVERDRAKILGDLTGTDRKLVDSRLGRLPDSCLRVLAHQEVDVNVYSYLKTLKTGANGTFTTAFRRDTGEISSLAIGVARQAIPGGRSEEFSRAPHLAWSGILGAAGVAVAALAGPPGWALGVILCGLAAAPLTDTALSNMGGSTLEHEVTHALDSAQGLQGSRILPLGGESQSKGHYYSENSPDVQACFAAAKKEKRFLSGVAKENIKEYFAEAGGAYLIEDSSRGLNRAKLKKKDPAMHKVMERFFESQIPNLAARL